MVGTLSLVLDLHIAQESWGSNTDPTLSLNGHLHYPNDQFTQHNGGGFHYRRVAFSSLIKTKTDSILGKSSDLRFILHIDGSTIISKSHTHPSHSQTSRLLTSSLSLGVAVPRTTKWM